MELPFLTQKHLLLPQQEKVQPLQPVMGKQYGQVCKKKLFTARIADNGLCFGREEGKSGFVLIVGSMGSHS
jgi:hypothetical protein